MTVIERFDGPFTDTMTFRVNGCVSIDISSYVLRTFEDYRRFVEVAVASLVWLAMPVHDVPLNQTARSVEGSEA
jgi:hypothetical protein